MINGEMRKSEKWEIELAILKAVKSNNGVFHQTKLASYLGYAIGTVGKYTLSLVDRELLAIKEDGRNQKLYITDRTEGKIKELESSKRQNDGSNKTE